MHRLLPEYTLFAGRKQKGSSQSVRVQVVTLVHVYMAAQASLLDVRAQYSTLEQSAPGELQQAQFVRMTDPRTDVTILVGNLYRYQPAQPYRLVAMLEVVSRALARWKDHTDLFVIGGDFNASLRPRVGYVGSETIARADAQLQDWCRRTALLGAVPSSSTWQSVTEARHTVLDCFFWQSRTAELSTTNVETWIPPDPRLDHDLVSVKLGGRSVGPLPPLEALRAPVRLWMHRFKMKRTVWQEPVTKSLTSKPQAPLTKDFQELEKAKRVALDCAREVLGTTGGTLSVLPNHSRETRQLKARLNLLKVVRREIKARQKNSSSSVPPSKAMRKVWDTGWWPRPTTFLTLERLWHPQNYGWTDSS